MGVLADRLDTMAITAWSPDRQVMAELRSRTSVRIAFAPGAYGRFSAEDMQHQLAALARLLLASRVREYRTALRDALGEPVGAPTVPQREADRRFVADRERIVAAGRGDGGCVELSTEAYRSWRVVVAPDALRDLAERTFCGQVALAWSRLVADHRRQVAELRMRWFG